MLLGNDYESTALAFRLEHEPGGFRNHSPANAQLAAVMIERVSGQPYEDFVDQRLWRRVGAGPAELQLDRRAGMPAAHCCWLATARGMLRIAALLDHHLVHFAGTKDLWLIQMDSPEDHRVHAFVAPMVTEFPPVPA